MIQETNEIMSKLAAIQQALKVGKDQRNEFAQFNYRSCSDIVEAVKPLLGEAVLTLSDEMKEIAGRAYVKATATLTYKCQSHSVTSLARESQSGKGMSDPQLTGSASTYARKYALCGLLAIDDSKGDPDQLDHFATQDQLTTIRDNFDKLRTNQEKIVKGVLSVSFQKKTKVEDLTYNEAVRLIGLQNQKLKKVA